MHANPPHYKKVFHANPVSTQYPTGSKNHENLNSTERTYSHRSSPEFTHNLIFLLGYRNSEV